MKPDYEVARTLMRMGNSDMMKQIAPEVSEVLDENHVLRKEVNEKNDMIDNLEHRLSRVDT